MWKVFKWGGIGLIGLGLLTIIGNAINVVGTVATAPGRVITKTLETDNIIHNYEWFHDTYAAFQARHAQLVVHRSFLKDETDPTEKQRLRMEFAAMQQSCRDLATRYNANSIKTNRSIFKGREAPVELDMSLCG